MKASITIKTRFGNYRTFIKEFESPKHLEAWEAKISRNGTKLISVTTDPPMADLLGREGGQSDSKVKRTTYKFK